MSVIEFVFFVFSFIFGFLILRLFLLMNHLQNKIFDLEEKVILLKKCLKMNNLTLKSKPSSKKIIDI